MTEDQMRRALGVLLNELAEIAFNDCGPEINADEAQDLLVRAGLATRGIATAEEAAACPFGATEPGDPWVALTEFALDCRLAARASPPVFAPPSQETPR